MFAQVLRAIAIALLPYVIKGLKAAWIAFIAYLVANSQVIRDIIQAQVPGPVGTALEYVAGLVLGQASFVIKPAKKAELPAPEADKDYS